MVNSRQAQRQRGRASALRDQASDFEEARAELGKIYDAGGRNRFHYVIRRDLVHARRVSPAAAPEPSPAAALAPLKGWALHLYLIAIFDAQSRRPAGTTVDNTRPLCRADSGEAGWADLLPAVTTTTGRRAGMRRQAVHAWNRLERENLAVISGQPGVAGRYNHVQLLDETGSGAIASWHRRYSIPLTSPFEPSRSLVMLPKGFFLNGWVHVLTAAEITTYLMILDLQNRYPETGREGVFAVASHRVERYGVHPDVYATHRELTKYGLIRRINDPARSPDGRVIKRSSQRYVLQPYRFRTLDEGFDRPALATVTTQLRSHAE
jgi:hypothetical protein